ncbi:MAG TPA: hypothetical protein VFF06_10525 [Polyangia bacterium]|nr:hypothetical protein [Polyangia bacterium]
MRRLLLIAAALAAGCSSTTPGSDDLGADLSPNMPPPDLAVAGPLHHVSSVWQAGGNPAAGASVCVVEFPQLPCAFADINGASSVAAPDHQNVTLRYTLAGAYPVETTVATSDHDLDIGALTISGNQVWDDFFTGLGITRDPAKGDLIVALRQVGTDAGAPVPVAGATVTLAPASGVVTYTLDDGTPSTAQTTTTSAGHLRVFNVNPGVVELIVNAGGLTCRAAFGWSGGDNMLGMRIDQSVRSVAIAWCT